MDFLKKESPEELSFKKPSDVPTPRDTSDGDDSVNNPFTHEDFMPPQPFSEQTRAPEENNQHEEHPSNQPSAENEFTHASFATEPVQESAQEPIPEAPEKPKPLVLPDLPELPKKEEPKHVIQESMFDKDIPDMTEETAEEPEIIESKTQNTKEKTEDLAEPLPELPDPYPEDTTATYLAEEHEDEEHEHYVDARVFYNTLTDIKAMKKSLRDQDVDMRAWEEIDDALDKKTTSILGSVDSIQEDLITIDTTLFEE